MITETEELQAKEFLKRAEVRTMKKDLRALRESDALKERNKIAKIRTLEEQIEEKRKIDAAIAAKTASEIPAQVKAMAEKDKTRMEEVLEKNEDQERIAEKDLKNYATEEERQQIFLLESQRLGFEKQIDATDKEKEPALRLEKNKLLLLRRDQQVKLNSILAEEKKLEDEMKFLSEKERTTTIASQKKGLEQSRWDSEKKIQDVEKRRWEVEKQIQDTDAKVKQTDVSSEQNVVEKNSLRERVLGVDKSLREIYSVIMAREEEKRKGVEKEQVARREAVAEIKSKRNEDMQRQQWTGVQPKQSKVADILSKAPETLKEKMKKSFQAEEEQRRKFIQDVAGLPQDKKEQPSLKDVLQPESKLPPVPKPRTPSVLVPPVPTKK